MKNLPSESVLSLGWPVNISASLEPGCFFKVLSVVVYISPPTFNSTIGDNYKYHKGTKSRTRYLSEAVNMEASRKRKNQKTIADGNWNECEERYEPPSLRDQMGTSTPFIAKSRCRMFIQPS